MTTKSVFLDKPQLKSLADLVRSSQGKLVVLSGAIQNMSWFIMEDVKINLRTEGIQFIEMTKVGTGPVNVSGDCSEKIVVFDELRLQEGHEYSTELATRYLAAGATVVARVHGVDKDAVANRLFMLGMPKQVIQDKLKVMDYQQKIA